MTVICYKLVSTICKYVGELSLKHVLQNFDLTINLLKIVFQNSSPVMNYYKIVFKNLNLQLDKIKLRSFKSIGHIKEKGDGHTAVSAT